MKLAMKICHGSLERSPRDGGIRIAATLLVVIAVGCTSEVPSVTPDVSNSSAVDGMPASSPTDRAIYSDQLAADASQLFDEGRVEDALSLYAAAIEASPNSYELRAGRIRLLCRADRVEEATREVESCIKSGIGNKADLYWTLGDGCLKAGKGTTAIDAFTKAIDSTAPESDLFERRGDVYRWMGEQQRAFDDYSRAIALSRPNSNLVMKRANAAMRSGQARQALADVESARRVDLVAGAELDAMLALILATAEDDDVRDGETALALAKQAAAAPAVHPVDRAIAKAAMAAAYAELNDFDSAVAHQEAALEILGEEAAEEMHGQLKAYKAKERFRYQAR